MLFSILSKKDQFNRNQKYKWPTVSSLLGLTDILKTMILSQLSVLSITWLLHCLPFCSYSLKLWGKNSINLDKVNLFLISRFEYFRCKSWCLLDIVVCSRCHLLICCLICYLYCWYYLRLWILHWHKSCLYRILTFHSFHFGHANVLILFVNLSPIT